MPVHCTERKETKQGNKDTAKTKKMAVQTSVQENVDKHAPDKLNSNKNGVDNRGSVETKNNEVCFEDLLSSAGEFGLYQLLLFLSTFPFYTFGVFAYFSQLFMTEASPNHWCWIPELENLTDIDRRNLAIPSDEHSRFGYSKCTAYVANWTEVLALGVKPNHTWPTTKCENGWEFNKTEIPYPTITSEMEWVCDHDSNQATAQTVFFLGSITGGFVIGWVSDRFGRLPAAVISNLIGCIGGIGSVFARNFIEFSICRYFTGIAYDNCMIMVYLIVLEYIAPKYRTLISNLSFAIFYSSAVIALPWISLACGNWRIFTLVTSLPLGLAVLAPLVMPESPKWLLSRGRVDDAVMKLRNIAKINKKEIPQKSIEEFKAAAVNMKEENKGSMIDLMRRPILRKVFMLVCLEYICCSLVFDGLVRSIGLLDFDFFLSFTMVSSTEFPSVLILAFVMDWMGRRWLCFISMTFSCIFCVLSVFVGGGWISVMCAVIARFSVNMAFGSAMQWAAEVLPVSVRGSGVAIVHICGFIGYLLSPTIVYLESYIHWLPLVLIGSIAGLGGVIPLFLPETAMTDMPQSFDDAEDLVMSQKFWNIPCLRKKVGKKGQDNNSFTLKCNA